MRPLVKVAALVLFATALTISAQNAMPQYHANTQLQSQAQSASEAEQFEMLSPDNMQSLVECAEWAVAISGVWALARILLRRPRAPLVLFPVELAAK